MQTVKDADNALPQRSAAHNAVIDNDQIVYTGLQTAVCDVIHMGGKVIAAVPFCNKSAQFDVLHSHFLTADAP